MGLVQTFCFCIDLKWSALVCGIVDIILSFLAGYWLRWLRRIKSAEYDYWTLAESGFFTSRKVDEIYLNKCGHILYTFLVVVLVLHICACIMLIISCHTEKKSLVAPYVCTSLMRFVLLLLILIWIVTKSHDSAAAYWIIGLSLGTGVYFWFAAVSWFQAAA